MSDAIRAPGATPGARRWPAGMSRLWTVLALAATALGSPSPAARRGEDVVLRQLRAGRRRLPSLPDAGSLLQPAPRFYLAGLRHRHADDEVLQDQRLARLRPVLQRRRGFRPSGQHQPYSCVRHRWLRPADAQGPLRRWRLRRRARRRGSASSTAARRSRSAISRPPGRTSWRSGATTTATTRCPACSA